MKSFEKNTAKRGLFRRRIIAEGREGRAFCAIEDDFHHYEVLIQHDGSRITATEALSPRTPYTTCAAAMTQLDALVGRTLSPDIFRRRDLPDPHFQCTHMYEAALLAIAQALRGGKRRYDIAVTDRTLRGSSRPATPEAYRTYGRARAELYRDDALVLAFDLEGQRIIAPAPFAGQAIRTVGGWAAVHCDDETLERVKLLRRGAHVAGGRLTDLDSQPGAFVLKSAYGACYSFQPERVDQAFRIKGSIRDFTASADALLTELAGK